MNRNVRLAPIGLAVVVAIMMAGCVGTSAPTHSATSSSTPAPTTTPTPSSSAEANSTTTVASDKLNWAYPNRYLDLVKSAKFGIKTEKVGGEVIPVFTTGSTDTTKLWSDATCPALAEESRDAIVVEILTKPDCGAMAGNALYNALPFDTAVGNISLRENNPWLAEFGFNDPTHINDWAMAAMNATGKVRVQYAKKLALIAELIERLHVTTIGDGMASSSYTLVVSGVGNAASVDKSNPEYTIPEFTLSNIPYKGRFIYLSITIKGQPSGCNYIGVNVGYGGIVDKNGHGGDGRFAQFVCPPPPPPAPSVPITSPPVPVKRHSVESCASVYPKFPYGHLATGCKDGAGHDPSYQGHNRPGGNGVAPVQTDQQGAPAGGTPPATYTVPSAPPSVGPPAGSTPGGDTGGAPQGGSGLN